MYQENVVLCASSAYEKKFWLNDDFQALPEQIKQELKRQSVRGGYEEKRTSGQFSTTCSA